MAKFVRDVTQQLLQNMKGEKLFQECLLDDIKEGRVFPAFRKNRIDFYYGGGKIFSYSDKGFVTHIKYASVLSADVTYVTESHKINPLGSFIERYEGIKRNCKNLAGVEAQGVLEICQSFPNILEDGTDARVVALDIEICFDPSNDALDAQDDVQLGLSRNRLDLLLFNLQTERLRFYEAKHYGNPELWPKGSNAPKVLKQLDKYTKLIEKKEPEILEQYNKYVGLVENLFDLSHSLRRPKAIDDVPLMLWVFGFDSQQRPKLGKLLQSSMKSTPNYSCGGVNVKRLDGMWKK